MWVGSLAHSKDATNTLRGLMISMELELAVEAPHDLVLLDGSYIVLLIYLHQGLATFCDAPYLSARSSGGAGLTSGFSSASLRWLRATEQWPYRNTAGETS